MRITFDNEIRIHLLPGEITGMKLRQELQLTCPDRPKIIVFFRADAGPNISFSEASLQEVIYAGANSVDFTTATARELAIVSIYDSVVLLEHVKHSMKASSKLLQSGDFEEAMMRFSGSIRELKNVVNMVRAISGAGLANMTYGKKYMNFFNENTGGVNDMLTRIEESIGVEDSACISDIIEYELFPIIDTWQNTMPSLYKDVLDSSSLH